ncbi:unnamed protein product, partial [Dovyalis caffra]
MVPYSWQRDKSYPKQKVLSNKVIIEAKRADANVIKDFSKSSAMVEVLQVVISSSHLVHTEEFV